MTSKSFKRNVSLRNCTVLSALLAAAVLASAPASAQDKYPPASSDVPVFAAG